MITSNSLFRSFSRLTGRFLSLAGETARRRRAFRRSQRAVTFMRLSESLEERTMLTVYVINTASDAPIEGGGAVTGKLSLREAIIAANTNAAFGDAAAGEINGDVIKFDPTVFGPGLATTITLTRGQMVISDDLRIDGGNLGITIDADGRSRIFEVIEDAANPITISNLRMINGNAMTQDGGAIRVRVRPGIGVEPPSVSLINNVFEDNFAARGGAVSNNQSIVAISGSTLINNDADIDGGAVWNNGGTTSIVGGLLEGNTAVRNGGAVENSGGTLVIRGGAVLSKNASKATVAGQGGGALFSESGRVVLNGATIVGNKAAAKIDDVTPGAASGGGLFIVDGDVSVFDSKISGNQASRSGGGIEIAAGKLGLRNALIGGDLTTDGNIAAADKLASPGQGGGINISGAATVDIAGGVIRNNVAAAQGGGIRIAAGATLSIHDGAIITDNQALGTTTKDGGGGIYGTGATISISDSIIRGNTATAAIGVGTPGKAAGGGIFSIAGKLNIINSTIAGNIANSSGGGVQITDGTAVLNNVVLGGLATIDGNIAGPTGGATPGSGGGLSAGGNAVVFVEGGLVQNNVAAREGGGLWNSKTGTMIVRNGASISGNRANGAGVDAGGGGIYNDGGRLALTDAVVRNNVATGALSTGGGIRSLNGMVTIANSTIAGNIANKAGGGIEVVNGSVVLNNSVLGGLSAGDGNVAGPAGSAAPGLGGGLHVTGTAKTFINGGLVQNNIAALEGGGLWNQSGATMVIRDGAMIRGNVAQGNAADDGGGGIFNNGGTIFIVDSFIRQNKATGTGGSGGGIFSMAGAISITGSQVSANSAPRAGGGIEAVGGTVKLNRSVLGGFLAIDGNIAGGASANPGSGGGLHVTGAATVYVQRSTVQNNVAKLEGGGLWNSATGTMIVQDGTVIADNKAQGAAADDGGGGIFNNGGRLAVTNSLIAGNRATGALGSGGGIFSVGGLVTVAGSTIAANVANRAGGGIEVIDGSVVLNNSKLGGDSPADGNVAGPAGSASPGNGGGLHVTGVATVFVDGGLVANNIAANEGGGLWNQAGATMFVRKGARVAGNRVTGTAVDDGGAGLFNNGGVVSITEATFDGNISGGSGGGVLNNGGNISIVRSTLSANQANGKLGGSGGGGLFNAGGSVARITNSTFSGNSANHDGGGIANAGSAEILNVTIVLNRANDDSSAPLNGGFGGGIAALSGGTTLMHNSIVAGNLRFGGSFNDDINGTTMSGASSYNIIANAATAGGLLDGVNNNIVGIGGFGTIPLDTIVSPTLGNNGGPTFTHALVTGSIAIDSGNNALAPDLFGFDQRGTGFPRLKNGIVDRGSFEF